MGNEYVEGRLKDLLGWTNKRAKRSRRMFHSLQIVIIVAGALVSIVNVFQIDALININAGATSAILGGIIVICTALLQLFKYHENWLLWRTTNNLLKREKFYFLHDAGNYTGLTDVEKTKRLVEQSESIFCTEFARYQSINQPKDAQQTPPVS